MKEMSKSFVSTSRPCAFIQLSPPALQRSPARLCVSCARAADSYCAGCGVTPYCSDVCQRRDWEKRHRGVCHNLASLSTAARSVPTPLENDVATPPPTALRRPHASMPKPNQNASFNSDKNNTSEKRTEQPNNQDRFKNNSRLNKLTNRSNQNAIDGHAENRDSTDGRMRRPFNKNANNDNRPPPAKQNENSNGDNEIWESAKSKPSKSAENPTVTQVPPQIKTTKPEPVKQVEQRKVPMLSVADVMPVKKIVPKNYVPEVCSIGDDLVLCVENRSKEGLLCSCMHESVQEMFQSLMDEYSAACEADPDVISPRPGMIFSLHQPDGAWYRARMLNAAEAALIDASKIVRVDNEPAKKITNQYANIPEFCCLLQGDVQVGDNLQCTLISKTPQGYNVSIVSLDRNEIIGQGVVSRWTPDVEYPKPVTPITAPVPAAAPSNIVPEISRPPLTHNSKVILVEAETLQRALVLDVSKQRDYDRVLQSAVIVDNPLKTPPQKGQVVIGKYSDGLCYRALCKRTNVKLNKYLVEYIEFGNEEKTTLENLHECPPALNLDNSPCVTSLVKLADEQINEQATLYITALKDSSETLVLTLPGGVKTAPSGSEATLTVEKNNENINKKLQQMCMPEWKRIKDVMEIPPLMYSLMKYNQLPLASCELDVLCTSDLKLGIISACLKGDKTLDYISGPLTDRMTEYCNSDVGKAPYLPASEELCIAQWHINNVWYRGVVLEQLSGAGGQQARVLFLDYGNTELLHVAQLRKMLPEFVETPAAACHIDIYDFPSDPTDEIVARAEEYITQGKEGRGTLLVDKLVKQSDDPMYTAHCRGLIAAVNNC